VPAVAVRRGRLVCATRSALLQSGEIPAEPTLGGLYLHMHSINHRNTEPQRDQIVVWAERRGRECLKLQGQCNPQGC